MSFCNASTAGVWGKRPPRAGLWTSLRQGNKPAWGGRSRGHSELSESRVCSASPSLLALSQPGWTQRGLEAQSWKRPRTEAAVAAGRGREGCSCSERSSCPPGHRHSDIPGTNTASPGHPAGQVPLGEVWVSPSAPYSCLWQGSAHIPVTRGKLRQHVVTQQRPHHGFLRGHLLCSWRTHSEVASGAWHLPQKLFCKIKIK